MVAFGRGSKVDLDVAARPDLVAMSQVGVVMLRVRGDLAATTSNQCRYGQICQWRLLYQKVVRLDLKRLYFPTKAVLAPSLATA